MADSPPPYTQSAYAADLFASQVAIVTGGGTGIGFATAQLLHKLGAQVALLGRRKEILEEAAQRIEPDKTRVFVSPCDIREPARVEAAVGEVLDRFGKIDVLINNAGGQFAAPAHAIGARGFAAVIQNNLLGTFHMIREVAQSAFFEADKGVVVNVTMPTLRGVPLMAHSGAARAGVENLTRTLAVEWAARHIRLNCLAPGVIQTEAMRKNYPPELVEAARRATPLQRFGTAREVACGICYLASPLAAFVTGTTLNMDGGAQLTGDPWSIAMSPGTSPPTSTSPR